MAIPEEGSLTEAESHALWSQQILEHAVDFHFDGTAYSYMEFDVPGGVKRLVYVVYALMGINAAEVTRSVTESMRGALADARASIGPIAIVWRARPELELMSDTQMWRYYTRLAVIDTDLNQLNLPSHFIKLEGDPTQLLEANPNA